METIYFGVLIFCLHIFKYLLKYEKLRLSGHHLCLKHDFFMIDEHQDFISIFVCIHGNLSGRVVDGIGAVIFKSLYKNKREVWVPGWVAEIMACPRIFRTKTTQKSTFFKMGVSLGRPHWKRDIIRISNRWRRTGQQRTLYN